MRKPTRLPSGSYRTRVDHPVTGQRISITAATEDECVARAEWFRSQRERYRLGLVSREELLGTLGEGRTDEGRLRLADLYRTHVATYGAERSRRTAESYWRRWIAPFWGEDAAPQDLTPDRLRAWEDWMVKGRRARQTIRAIWGTLAAAVRRALRENGGPLDMAAPPWGEGRRAWQPSGRGREERERVVLPPDQLERLLAQAGREDRARIELGEYADARLAILLGVYTGARNAELCALRWSQIVEHEDGRWSVVLSRQAGRGWRERAPDGPDDPTKHSKGKRHGEPIELHPTLIEALRVHRDMLRALDWYREDGPVLPSPRLSRPGAPTWRSREGIRSAGLAKLASRAGVELGGGVLVPHALRHAFVTYQLAAGADPREVQALARHADFATTAGYYRRIRKGMLRPQLPELGAGGEPLCLPAPPDWTQKKRGSEIVPTALEAMNEAEGRFEEILRREAPAPGTVPRAVAEYADQRRRAVKQAVFRRPCAHGGSSARTCDQCRALARRVSLAAKRGVLGAWAKFVRRQEKQRKGAA